MTWCEGCPLYVQVDRTGEGLDASAPPAAKRQRVRTRAGVEPAMSERVELDSERMQQAAVLAITTFASAVQDVILATLDAGGVPDGDDLIRLGHALHFLVGYHPVTVTCCVEPILSRAVAACLAMASPAPTVAAGVAVLMSLQMRAWAGRSMINDPATHAHPGSSALLGVSASDMAALLRLVFRRLPQRGAEQQRGTAIAKIAAVSIIAWAAQLDQLKQEGSLVNLLQTAVRDTDPAVRAAAALTLPIITSSVLAGLATPPGVQSADCKTLQALVKSCIHSGQTSQILHSVLELLAGTTLYALVPAALCAALNETRDGRVLGWTTSAQRRDLSSPVPDSLLLRGAARAPTQVAWLADALALLLDAGAGAGAPPAQEPLTSQALIMCAARALRPDLLRHHGKGDVFAAWLLPHIISATPLSRDTALSSFGLCGAPRLLQADDLLRQQEEERMAVYLDQFLQV